MRSEYRAHVPKPEALANARIAPQCSARAVILCGRIFLVGMLAAALYAQAPQAVSVSPNSGSGTARQFTFVWSDVNGFGDIRQWASVIFDTAVHTSGPTCRLLIDTVNRNVYLSDDSGGIWSSVPIGSSGTLQNTQCKVNGGSTLSGTGNNNLTFGVNMLFSLSYAGTKSIFMWAQNAAGVDNGYQPMGGWTVAAALGATSILPPSGTGLSQIFTATYTDPVAYTNLTDAQFLVQTGVNGYAACYLRYNVATDKFYLANDAAVWQAPITPGSPTYSENGQCVLSGSDSNATGWGTTTLTVHFAIGFKNAFAGQKNTYIYTSNASSVTGWQQPASSSWNIQAIAQPPGSLAVQPSSGSGGAGTFTPFAFSGSSVNGFEYLESIQMIFNWTVDGANGCYIQYYRSANAIYLVNDAGTAALGGYAPGTSGAFIENSQCKIDVGATTVTGAFNTLTLHPSLLFKTGFPGPQSTFLYMSDLGNQASGWQQVGTWTGYAASTQPPAVLAANPASGTGLSSTFIFHTTDVNGYKYIPYQQILIGTTFGNAVSSCSLLYYQGWNTLYLADDANGSWGNPVVLGTPGGTLSNTQCTIDVAHSSLSGSSGNDLYLSLPVTFFPAFGGAKIVSMYATDHAFNSLGWQQVSTWTVGNAPQPDFSLNISPSSQNASPGTSIPYTITVTGSNGFNTPVNFSASGLPSGATISFSPAPITSGQSTTLTINVPTNVQPGNYTGIIVTGSSGSLSHTTPAVSLNVLAGPDFTLSLATGSAPLWPGGIAIYTVTATGPLGFNDTVSFSATGLPSWATGTFYPIAVRGTAYTQLTINATNAAPQTGTYTFTVGGQSGSFSHTIPASITMGSAPLTVGASDGPPRTSTVVISGRITGAQGGIAGVQVQLSGSATASTTTDSQGHFQFMNLAIGGTYTATPTPFGSTVFGPTNVTWTSLQTNATITFLGYGQ
jgi:hypothetical protein